MAPVGAVKDFSETLLSYVRQKGPGKLVEEVVPWQGRYE